MKLALIFLATCCIPHFIISAEQNAEKETPKSSFEIRLADSRPWAQEETSIKLTKCILRGTKETFFTFPEKHIIAADIEQASIEDYRDGSQGLAIRFTDKGAVKFRDFSQRYVGKTMAVFLNGDLVSTPTVKARTEVNPKMIFSVIPAL